MRIKISTIIILVLSFGFCEASFTPLTWKTSENVKVYFKPAKEIPMVDIRMVFSAGSIRDDKKLGVANMTNQMLLEGSGALSALQFKDKAASLGASFSVGSLREMAYINLRTLSDDDYFQSSVNLMLSAVTQPLFAQDEIDVVRKRNLLKLKINEQSLSKQANRSVWSHLYKNHSYGNPPLGEEKYIKKITKDDLRKFHEKFYVAENLVLVIVGDIEEKEARRLASTLSSKMKRGQRPSPVNRVPTLKATTLEVGRPSKQSHIRIASIGMRRDDDDYFPLLIGNHAFGGNSLVSILFREVRSKRGLSYSTYSYFLPMEQFGPMVVGMQTDSAKKEEALKLLRSLFERFTKEGPTQREFALAKSNLINGFVTRIDSNRKVTEYLAMIGYYGLPLDYLENFEKNIEEVTLKQVKDALNRRLSDDYLTVVVGS